MSKKKESKTFLLFVTLLGLSLGCAKSEPSTDDTSSDSNASESSDAESPEGDDTDDGGRGYRFGMGLDYVSPWTTQIVFVDAFKQTKPWDGYQNGTTEWITDIDDIPLPLSSRGYPAVDIPFDHDNDEQTGGFVVYTTVFSAVGDSYP